MTEITKISSECDVKSIINFHAILTQNFVFEKNAEYLINYTLTLTTCNTYSYRSSSEKAKKTILYVQQNFRLFRIQNDKS